MVTLLGTYRPGTTWLHRMPAGAKMLALMALSTVVVVLRGPVSGAAALAVALGLVAWSGTGFAATLRSLRPFFVMAAILLAYHLLFGTWQVAVEQVGDLLALVLLATVLTATTPVDELLDTIVRALGPLRRVGVNPEKVALAFSLVLRTIPMLLTIAGETRDAARARGLERNPRTWLTPFVVRTVAHARDTGDALHARGLGDD
ncbi:energy-coupling factor transporter transmembrane component T family protein [Nocardioides daphniae]|uniref:Cobalt ABC transporter n=1 Tax=Nocardioides daphniae TaxID=402297 RepID=A0A4P7U9S0_9ACTN|nr:energy-coupling factor transporter transmembrane component T [Nocardioides daphniae]QCC76873.1 energy-coupling factor transporter transmembrane protein EcfT [Nocardioides daphniae]GGD17300.1 cobalt ABC transporter [Nocardioides daphniae]